MLAIDIWFLIVAFAHRAGFYVIDEGREERLQRRELKAYLKSVE